MADIEKCLQQLKSPNKNKRFDACYDLRRMKDIPENAILALQEVVNDPDSLVAREARKALQVHSPNSLSPLETETTSKSSAADVLFLTCAVILIIAGLIVFGMPAKPGEPLPGLAFLNNCIPSSLLIIFGVILLIGYSASKKNDRAQVGKIKTDSSMPDGKNSGDVDKPE